MKNFLFGLTSCLAILTLIDWFQRLKDIKKAKKEPIYDKLERKHEHYFVDREFNERLTRVASEVIGLKIDLADIEGRLSGLEELI